MLLTSFYIGKEIHKKLKNICKKDALKYKTKKEYRDTRFSSYAVARQRKWIDEICSHMKIMGNRKKRCIYAYEFPDHSVYVGLTYNIEDRQNRRNSDLNDQVTKYVIKTGLIPKRKQLTEYVPVEDAIKLEQSYVDIYFSNNWVILNKRKAGGIGGTVKKWTYQKCKNIVKKYNSLRKFKLDYPGAFSSIHRNGWASQLFSHIDRAYKPIGYWTYENCKKEASKYKKSSHFKLNCQYGYIICCKNKWINEFYNF